MQGAFEGAAFLGQVAAAVGGDAAGEGAVDLGEAFLGDHRDQLGAAPGAYEGHGVDALHGQVGQQVRRLGGGGAADGGALLAVEIGERGLPEGEDELSAGRGVVGDLEDRETRQALRSDGRVGGGGGRQQEHGFRAVAGAQTAQTAQDLGDVGPEDAAIGVALVDDDVLERFEEGGPAGV